MGVEALSERQREVLRLRANGYTARRIARLGYLSSYTVREHTTRAYRHLGLYGCGSAIAAAIALLDHEQPGWRGNGGKR